METPKLHPHPLGYHPQRPHSIGHVALAFTHRLPIPLKPLNRLHRLRCN